MSQRKNYSRYFIILQEDEKGYGLSADKMPTGYAKLEVKNGKCKITFYVQNLKIDMKPYYIMLICNKKDEKKLIKLSELNIDDSGRAEISREYNAADINKSGIAVDKVSGAAVAKLANGGLTSILSGFTSADKSKEWKRYDIIGESVEEGKVLKDGEAEKFEKYEKEIEEIKREEMPKTSKSQSQSIKEKEHIVEAVIVEEKVEGKQELKEEIKEETSKKSCNIQQEDSNKNKFFYELVKDLMPAQYKFGEAKWFEVKVDSIEAMYIAKTYKEYAIIYYPMINYYPYIIKHGHYVVSCKEDEEGNIKTITYGIAGSKSLRDQPFGGKYGFTEFIGADEGYWILTYDLNKGEIVR